MENAHVKRVHIRWMIRRDLPEVTAIDTHSFARPMGEATMLAHLRQRNAIGMVVEVDDKIVGCMIYSLHKHRVHIVLLMVHKDNRQQGLAGQMLTKLRNKLSTHRRKRVTVDVLHGQEQEFFQGNGFVPFLRKEKKIEPVPKVLVPLKRHSLAACIRRVHTLFADRPHLLGQIVAVIEGQKKGVNRYDKRMIRAWRDQRQIRLAWTLPLERAIPAAVEQEDDFFEALMVDAT